MARYWVVGGEYETTNFRVIRDGGVEERVGPFDSREAARVKWAEMAMKTVDQAHVRYRIEEEASTRFWVVGGRLCRHQLLSDRGWPGQGALWTLRHRGGGA